MPTPNSTVEPVKTSTPTPGPWKVEPVPAEAYTDPDIKASPDEAFWIVDEPVGEVLAIVQRYPLGQAEANARVMAAGQDMLQALHEIADDCYQLDGVDDASDVPHCRFCDHSEGKAHDPDCAMHFVNDAIAKAEGMAS